MAILSDDEASATLSRLEATLNACAAQTRRSIVLQGVAVVLLMLADFWLIWEAGGQWQVRDALMISAFSVTATLIVVSRAADWHYGRARDVRELSLMRIMSGARRQPWGEL